MSNHNCLKIIFNLNNREHFLDRYFNLLKFYNINFDILVISENQSKIKDNLTKKINTNIIIKKLQCNILGMNSIFKSIYDSRNILEKYEYICFVEDDNFIFPCGIDQCVKFLNQNNNYIACNGESFLYTKEKKYKYLNKYSSPNFHSNNLIDRAKQYKKNGGLVYYSIIRGNYFIEICKEIKNINDDNLSEVFFNYLLLIYGNLKTLKILYLAREYPRPKIYNIPLLQEWIKNKKLIRDLLILLIRIEKNILFKEPKIKKQAFLKLTIFNYISKRIKPVVDIKKISIFKNVINKFNNTRLQNKKDIRSYLININFMK